MADWNSYLALVTDALHSEAAEDRALERLRERREAFLAEARRARRVQQQRAEEVTGLLAHLHERVGALADALRAEPTAPTPGQLSVDELAQGLRDMSAWADQAEARLKSVERSQSRLEAVPVAEPEPRPGPLPAPVQRAPRRWVFPVIAVGVLALVVSLVYMLT
ncbi:MAG TPA: hypothetical protein PKE40_00715 [Arachnia sp.]|nr:hypothetical protein [Arachnia sp.]HMT84848.1 hypothetical protein [Arachnia sp.]